MQNDVWFKDAVLDHGVYPFPIGSRGVSMVDARDVAEAAALAVLERERSTEPLPHRIVNLVGPEPLTGEGNARTWSRLLGKTVRYGGDATAPFEQKMRGFGPSWAAMDLRLMLDRFVTDGMQASALGSTRTCQERDGVARAEQRIWTHLASFWGEKVDWHRGLKPNGSGAPVTWFWRLSHRSAQVE